MKRSMRKCTQTYVLMCPVHSLTDASSVFCLQDDKDLVPEFVASEGLTCFIKVGAEADHNYQNYILRGETQTG